MKMRTKFKDGIKIILKSFKNYINRNFNKINLKNGG